MKYQDKSFSSRPATREYLAGWDRAFAKCDKSPEALPGRGATMPLKPKKPREAVTTISVVNWSDGRIADDIIERACDAVSVQVAECAQAWGLDPWPVHFVAENDPLDYGTTHLMAIVPELDPGVAGYHDSVAGVIYGKVLVRSAYETSKTLSHECLEMLVDPDAKQWRAGIALEVCDPVEADVYESGGVALSNYILPAWFETTSQAPYDRMHRLSKPLTMSRGGYEILQEPDGTSKMVFADLEVGHSLYRRLINPDSRTLRRLRR